MLLKRKDPQDDEWRKKLAPAQYHVLREKGTERPWTGKWLANKDPGTYICAGCGADLFTSDTKFESGTGWPSFYKPADETCIREEDDSTFGMRRVEVMCKKCGGHLGHVFDDGPEPTGLRYCINSLALGFKKREGKT
ncbi:MAG: peptide-methionine (R)-S-oxide reductase MsrB [Euryarchaeota archaeon]|nr:peptide-methionine (R)-S-oxide reductase MsrB [Euryarchaeota archaeon]